MQSDHYNLQREAEFLASAEVLYQQHLEQLSMPPIKSSAVLGGEKQDSDEDALDAEILALELELAVTKQKRIDTQTRRVELSKRLHDVKIYRDSVSDRINFLSYEKSILVDRMDSVEQESQSTANKLQKYMQMNALNDVFFIWYSGPFATINNFKLGNLPSKVVDWAEINAALGQAVLVVSTVAIKARIEFKKYSLVPQGSFPRLIKLDDKRVLYLWKNPEGSWTTVFPVRNFNVAMTAFLTCVQELGDHVKRHDPTLCPPYAINVNDSIIHDQSIVLGGDDEIWTRALKYLLADIKWIVAWHTKHCNCPI